MDAIRTANGQFAKGYRTPWPNTRPNRTSFVKGQRAWNTGLPAPWTVAMNHARKGKPNPARRRLNHYHCRQCGTAFARRPSYPGRGWFCGLSCTNAWRGTDEFKQAQSLRTSRSQKALWKDPSHRQRMGKLLHEPLSRLWKDPVWSSARRQAMRALWTADRKTKLSQRMRGPHHPNWQGGKSSEPYGLVFDRSLRESVRFRDGYKCQRCGAPQVENGRALVVHHKDCNKQNNTFSNLTSLCNSCHLRLHWEMKQKDKKLCV